MARIEDRIIAELKRDGRASVSEIATRLGVSRATVRLHMDRLVADGTILGYTVVLSQPSDESEITGIITIALVGGTIERVVAELKLSRFTKAIYLTHGTWDVVLEFSLPTLNDLERLLALVRDIDGVERSDTSIYLKQRHG